MIASSRAQLQFAAPCKPHRPARRRFYPHRNARWSRRGKTDHQNHRGSDRSMVIPSEKFGNEIPFYANRRMPDIEESCILPETSPKTARHCPRQLSCDRAKRINYPRQTRRRFVSERSVLRDSQNQTMFSFRSFSFVSLKTSSTEQKFNRVQQAR